MTQALYRRYRPESFSDVRGQEHITKVLAGGAKDGQVAHAYLFSGRRGIGKTSVARILAKELGTTERDIYEIDAASHRGIDDIRELKEAVGSLPYESDYKVYIIDEVHMLTTPAFNALLKTLEEPPEFVIFILATTELDRLPETIISRCETHEFQQPSMTVLAKAVQDTAAAEKYTIDEAAATTIAQAADGSFRDAFGLLEKCMRAAEEKHISGELAAEITGIPANGLIEKIVFDGIADGEPAAALTALQKAADKNIDPARLFARVIQTVRQVLLLRFAPDLGEGIKESVGEQLYSKIKKAADAGGDSNLHAKTLHTLLSHHNKLSAETLGHLPLELAIISLTEKK
ncbi:MAG: DNA polymerase III subunit gamma/tau [Candidatus Paceibacterota bacterium]